MICRNCNYILSGNEQFCPHCGFSLNNTADQSKPPSIFTSEKGHDNDEIKQPANRIFLSPDENPPYEESTGKGRKTAVIVSLSLLLILLCSCAVFAFQKLDISPVISSFFPDESTTAQEETTTEAPVSAVTGRLEKNFGIITPEILYKPTNCHTVSNNIIPVRKGPGDHYGQTAVIDMAQQVQIIGGSVANKDWVYIFLPSSDCYGWIKGAYLTQSDSLEESTTVVTSEESEETTILE